MVATYAFVNPVVAILLGYFLLDEPIGRRSFSGGVLVVLAVGRIVGGKYTAGDVTEESLDGKACYKLTLTPTGKSAYTRLVVWIDTTSYLLHQSHYFDKKDKHVKTLTMAGYHRVSGVWTPQTMVMKNEKRGSSTTIEMVSVEYGIEVDERTFTTETLTTF